MSFSSAVKRRIVWLTHDKYNLQSEYSHSRPTLLVIWKAIFTIFPFLPLKISYSNHSVLRQYIIWLNTIAVWPTVNWNNYEREHFVLFRLFVLAFRWFVEPETSKFCITDGDGAWDYYDKTYSVWYILDHAALVPPLENKHPSNVTIFIDCINKFISVSIILFWQIIILLYNHRSYGYGKMVLFNAIKGFFLF